jgi:hypothetical protein
MLNENTIPNYLDEHFKQFVCECPHKKEKIRILKTVQNGKVENGAFPVY